uniref:Hamartin n=1 Tax=Diabrotica virgifera virgifera TaxID=50390 RepID=A0A6P7F9D8_DIAVI
MTELFENLESNNRTAVEDAKEKLRELFLKVNEPWLLNGLYEYYLSTSSPRAMEILVNIKEPHHIYLFDRISDSIKGPKVEIKVQALTLFGYVARRQPTWLYKLQEHILLRDILKLLRNEVELLPLISALLVLIVLLPMIPSSMGNCLRDIFDIFSRLASWNCNPGKIVEDQLIHMQVALYALFLRLYGMYPCNFLGYLKVQYKDKNTPVFVHTIKPMLDTVKMHPSLVTATEETEVTTERWRSMGVHDVIVECERFSLDLTDRCPHDSCQIASGFRSRSGTSNSTIESSYHLQNLKSLATLQMPAVESPSFFSPSVMFKENSSHFSSLQSSSPPEAAMEATPETTPVRVRDYRALSNRSQPLNSNIARALTTFTSKTRSGSVSTTPSHSQPSSPMHKEPSSPFSFPTDMKHEPIRHKVSKLKLDRFQITETSVSVTTDLTRSKPNPSSPLRITNAELSSRHFNISQRCESPRSLEDEVLSVVSKIDDPKNRGNQFSIQDLDEVLDVTLGEEPEHGSPCTEGGLHMPNSKSMNNFAKRVQRLRHHSTCNPEPEKLETSTGSSPGNGIPFSPSTTVRRAISCPEMKKSPTNPSKDNMDRPLKETDEDAQEKIGNFAPQKSKSATNNSTLAKSENKFIKTYSCTMTQTETFWPYEHLFLGVFPSLDNSEMKPSPDASPAPFHISQEKTLPSSIYDTLDHYIAVAVRSSDKHSKEHMKEQLELVHQQLLFERHRRETHAYRNRRLLSDAKSTRSLEEYNSALRDTVQLQQKDLDDLRAQLDSYKKERSNEDKKLNKTINYWEKQCKSLQEEVKTLEENNDRLTKDLTDFKSKCSISDTKLLELQEQLQETLADANTAKQEALQGVKVTKELQQVNKDMVMIGELHAKYQERLDSLDAGKVYQCELDEVRKACHDDVKVLNQQLDNKMASLEAYRTRVLELEHVIVSKDDLILSQKQMLAAINEEKFEKLEAVESKYQTQLTINRSLEEKILDLWQRLELGKTSVHSPDTSSCHEVNVTTTAGFSPHSSPLSASLASSEGSTAFHEREVKNLQAIVDQRETPSGSKSKFDESGDSLPEHEG